ncbi:MAG: metallopeptidase family protein [Candidatus Limnocylindrales bacterium]|jgi:predicted Zn-dependent protease with MMP-like domain
MPPDIDPPAESEPAESEPAERQPADSFAVDPFGGDESADPFEALVLAALDSLPDVFRERLGSVAIVIEDEASANQLASVRAPGLLGLYTGVPRTAWGADHVALASKITIFRGPHLRQYRDPDSLARGVTNTVRHEIAHHFGISDARLEELARERHHRGAR